VQLVFQALADRVEQDRASERFSLVRLTDRIEAPSFPHVVHALGALARFQLEPEEAGTIVKVTIGLVSASERRLHLDQRPRVRSPLAVGRPTIWDLALNLREITFQEPGEHHIVCRVDADVVAEIPVWVTAIE
jgi:hypothetical protein